MDIGQAINAIRKRKHLKLDAVACDLEALVAECGLPEQRVVDRLHEVRPQLHRRVEDLADEGDAAGVVAHSVGGILGGARSGKRGADWTHAGTVARGLTSRSRRITSELCGGRLVSPATRR